MYLRTVRARGGKGKTHEYVRLVEAYREGGKIKQRTVCNLGRKDLLTSHLDSLIRLLRGDSAEALDAGRAEATGAWDYGPMLVARLLWRELGLQGILDSCCGKSSRDDVSFGDRALVLVTSRLSAPSSEHGLGRWLEGDFVCERQGRRFVPQWRDDRERFGSRAPRVRVQLRQVKRWYRTLDRLIAHKESVERGLYLRLRDLFSLKVDLALYDLTSTYFEGVKSFLSCKIGFA